MEATSSKRRSKAAKWRRNKAEKRRRSKAEKRRGVSEDGPLDERPTVNHGIKYYSESIGEESNVGQQAIAKTENSDEEEIEFPQFEGKRITVAFRSRPKDSAQAIPPTPKFHIVPKLPKRSVTHDKKEGDQAALKALQDTYASESSEKKDSAQAIPLTPKFHIVPKLPKLSATHDKKVDQAVLKAIQDTYASDGSED